LFLYAGDTDSVFVCHKLDDAVASVTVDAVAEASRLTIALADRVNASMKAPKKLEFEKVYGTMLLLSKKRYGGLLYAPNHVWGTDPPIDIKGLQSQRRDGCPLVRDIVRDCLTSILQSGSSEDAAAMVRQRLVQLMDDTLPLEIYAIQKTLRKSMQDVCHPMSADEVSLIRTKIKTGGGNPDARGQLTYAEQDDAIRLKILLPWRLRIRLPHVMLAYRMREKDVGSAPVSGDIIRYIVTNNGRGNKIWEKAESLEVPLYASHHYWSCLILIFSCARMYAPKALRWTANTISKVCKTL
jgi:DNA polymerase delta subunit 1